MNEEWPVRVDALIEIRKYNYAVREIRQVLAQNPENALAYYYLAWVLGKLGKTKDALRVVREAVRYSPDDAQSHSLWGHLLDDTRKFKEAEVHHERAIQLMPQEAAFFVRASYHYYLRFPSNGDVIYPNTPLCREWDRGVQLAEQAIALDPRNVGAYQIRALWMIRRQRFAFALSDCLEALKINPNDPTSHELLGDIYLAEYKAPQAFMAYREALRLAPDQAVYRKKVMRAISARIPWLGALWRLSWGQSGGWRGALLAILVLLPFILLYIFTMPQMMCGYAFFIGGLFILLNTLGNWLIIQAVLKGWIKL